MDVNKYYPEINDNLEMLVAPYKENIQPEERNWIEKALNDVKNSDRSIKLEDRISRQLNAMETFTPDQIVRLVNILQQGIKLESNNSQIESRLCEKVAGLISEKNIALDRFIQDSADKNFAIKVTVKLVKQGKLDSLDVADYLLKCGLDPTSLEIQEALIEIAKLAAQQSGGGTSEYIQNYGIDASTFEGQQALIEIAKLAAQQSGGGTSQHIKNYGIDASKLEGQQALIEIAKLAARQDGWRTSQHIKNYGIDASKPEGWQSLIEIAKLAAQQNGWGVSENIKNYAIDASTKEGLQALVEIAKLAVLNECCLTLDYLQNYGIDASTPEGQQAMIEIAKQAAEVDGYSTAENIENFGINASTEEGQLAMIEIAKLAVQHDEIGLSIYIKNFCINTSTEEGRQAMIEIAQLAAQCNGLNTSQYIKSYGIDASTPEGQLALIKIAKLAAKKNGGGVSLYIQNYGIDASKPEGRQALIEIVKLAAQQSGWGVSNYIQNYGIDASTKEGQQVLIEIAKLGAEQNAFGILRNIQNYLLDTESVEGKLRYLELIQFLFTCFVKQFSSFKYSDLKRAFGGYSEVCNGNGVETYRIDVNQFEAQFKQFKAGDLNGAFQESLGIAAALFEMNMRDLQWVQDTMSTIKSKAEEDNIGGDEAEKDKKVKAEQEEFLEQWMSLCTLCASRKDLRQLFKENGPLFERLFQFSPALRIRIMQEVIAVSLDPQSLFLDRLKAELSQKNSAVDKIAVLPKDLRVAVTEVFLRGCHDSQADRVKHLRESVLDIVHARLACFILAEFPIQGSEVYLTVLAAIAKDRNFRNAKFQQPLLAALVALEKSSLEDDKKIKLLKDLFSIKNSEERLQGLKLITDILNFKGESYLGESSDLASLKATVEKLFVEKCKVKLDDFAALYQDSVGKWRGKEALLTYAGKHLSNPIAFPYFQRFLTAVLQGNFLQIRYVVENNPHLNQIKTSYPEIFKTWQQPVSLTAADITSKDSLKEIAIEIRVIDNLKMAVENRHLGLEKQEELFPIVSSCKGDWSRLDAPLELAKKKLTSLSNRHLTAGEIQEKQQLQLQILLMELMVDPSNLENKLNVLKGIKIKGLEQTLAPFYQDLEAASQLLRSSQKSSPNKMTMIDTDDPNHFLLMGTEVLGSCQNVNGSASLNVGVLGYALDGKHRLALVCDPSGKILARSVLRLLIDAEGNPVLFQERVYVADANPEYSLLLRKIALKKAELLSVPLVVSPSDFENERAKPYTFSIEAKDKPVPFEYVDALGGLRTNGYKIEKSLRIDPNT